MHYRKAVAIRPSHWETYTNIGNLLKFQGKLEEARSHYDLALSRKPDLAIAHFNRSELMTFRIGDEEFSVLEKLVSENRLSETERVFVHFAFARALESAGDHARAFEHLLKGNALKREQIAYDEAANLRYFEQICEVFDASLFERFQGAGDPSQTPIFVLGMPRSGSTMIEQILSCHPRVHGGGN